MPLPLPASSAVRCHPGACGVIRGAQADFPCLSDGEADHLDGQLAARRAVWGLAGLSNSGILSARRALSPSSLAPTVGTKRLPRGLLSIVVSGARAGAAPHPRRPAGDEDAGELRAIPLCNWSHLDSSTSASESN